MGLTDDEILESLMFDIRFQYALHTTSFEEQPLSDRTLSRFRARCLAYETETGIDLIHECITKMSKEIAEIMQIAPTMQRTDSLMIAANIKKLSFLELFYTCVSNLAKAMDARNICLPEELKHYLEKDDINKVIYHSNDRPVRERVYTVMKEGDKLLELCDGDMDDTSEYQLLIRLFNEQTIYDDGDKTRRLRTPDEFEHPSTQLRNPADSEATFRIKGGQHIGYVGNIVETVGENGSVITDYAYEQNIYTDYQFLRDYIEQFPENPETTELITLVADGAYGGSKNIRLAAEHGVNLIPTNFTSEKPADMFADFIFTDDGKELLRCAAGKHPIRTSCTKREMCRAKFRLEDCMNCPHRDICKPKFQKQSAIKDISWKTVDRAQKARFMKTQEFEELAHFRSGVEAIPSLLRRKYRVDKIPAHGKLRTRFYYGFKIGAINVAKLLAYTNSLDKCTQNSMIA